MADLSINLSGDIHAEIIGPGFMLSNTSIILDPLTNSYSELGVLNFYDLRIVESTGISNAVLLENGKNSRFSCSGSGKVVIELLIRDDQSNEDTDIITITVN